MSGAIEVSGGSKGMLGLRHQARLVDSEDAAGGARILVCLLGSVRLLKDGESIPLRPGGKTESLLAALALRAEQGVSRASLIDRIWSESDGSLAAQSLHSLVYSLHRRLGDRIGGSPPIVFSEGRYLLNLAAGVDVDTRQFERLVAGGDRVRGRGDSVAAEAAYGAAIRLYQGDVGCALDAHDVIERERLRSLQLNVLATLSEGAYERRQYADCLDLTMRLLAVDPCREDAHRLAMRCYVRDGERAQAFRQYRLCEGVLRAEFDTTPEPETRELFDLIRLAPDTV